MPKALAERLPTPPRLLTAFTWFGTLDKPWKRTRRSSAGLASFLVEPGDGGGEAGGREENQADPGSLPSCGAAPGNGRATAAGEAPAVSNGPANEGRGDAGQ